MFKKTLYISLFIAVAISNTYAGWQADLDSLLKTDNKAVQDVLIAAIVKAKPAWSNVSSYIQHQPFPAVEKGKVIVRQTTCIDNVQRPWALYIPSSYNPSKSAPLLVILHGAVMRPNIREDAQKWAEDYPFTALGERQGWLVLYPFGQAGAAWWQPVGLANILNLIRTTKRLYNVDDDRVWLGGFSDGASSSYFIAMIKPDDFAAFLALNGDLGFAGQAGNISTYVSNLSNSVIYAINTTEDDYFPASKVRKELELARNAGGQIFSKEYPGPHDFLYKDKELPLIANFLERHVRDPFPSRITWETADTHFGRCRWLAIDSLRDEKPAPWHKDFNLMIVDSSMIMGFASDTSYKGNGVMVGRIAMSNNISTLIGLRPNDIIEKINGQIIIDSTVFNQAKADLKRGQEVSMVVVRDGNDIPLNCRLPDPETYQLFNHDRLSGRINATFAANRIDIESSRVGKFRIMVHPDMVRIDQNLNVRVNGKTVYNKIVKPDLEFMLRNFLANRDRKLIYIREMEL